jgi:hypothetical protein
LLLLIALGLWVNALIPIIRPVAAKADDNAVIEAWVMEIGNDLKEIKNDVHASYTQLDHIHDGTYANHEIC